MVVVSMTNCPPKLRGDLSKWLLEINNGVYVGKVSARVRDALWKRICENISDGQATMVFNAQNEQHMDFYVHNTKWKPVDFDGIRLMKHINRAVGDNNSKLKPGFSYASKMRLSKRKRNKEILKSYIILDIETTGLSYENDEIIEIGYIKIKDGIINEKKNNLVKIDKEISDSIINLTGINNQMISENGIELNVLLKELFSVIKDKNVLIYNADFDLRFLEKGAEKCGLEFPNVNIIDVLRISRKRLKGIANYRLETVAASLGITKKQRHRAIDDCQLVFNIYVKLNEI